MATSPNLQLAVPFFMVTNMETSLKFYVEGLHFETKFSWIGDDGKVRWCWLQRGEVALMLQEYSNEARAKATKEGKFGVGVTICFLCEDAIAFYHELKGRRLEPTRPFVGNSFWVTTIADPDGYRLDFESKTDAEEESVYEER